MIRAPKTPLSAYSFISIWLLFVYKPAPYGCRDNENATISSIYSAKAGWLECRYNPVDKKNDIV